MIRICFCLGGFRRRADVAFYGDNGSGNDFLWWFLTPEQFEHLLGNGTVFISLILVLFGFTVSYWQMVQSPVSQKLVRYILPAVFALAGMSIATKEIAVHSQSGVWGAITYYLAVALFVSGCYNLFFIFELKKTRI